MRGEKRGHALCEATAGLIRVTEDREVPPSKLCDRLIIKAAARAQQADSVHVEFESRQDVSDALAQGYGPLSDGERVGVE